MTAVAAVNVEKGIYDLETRMTTVIVVVVAVVCVEDKKNTHKRTCTMHTIYGYSHRKQDMKAKGMLRSGRGPRDMRKWTQCAERTPM